MSKHIKYKWCIYADNDIEKEVVEHLKKSDMNVFWVAEDLKLKKEEDTFHYKKAKELKRYLLTYDNDFWSDNHYLLKDSPGVIILSLGDINLIKYLPVLLRKLINDCNPLCEPLYLAGFKIKLSPEGIALKGIDHDTQKRSITHWKWKEII